MTENNSNNKTTREIFSRNANKPEFPMPIKNVGVPKETNANTNTEVNAVANSTENKGDE